MILRIYKFRAWLGTIHHGSGVPRGGFGGFKSLPEIPKALQNRPKLNPIVKNVKNFWIWDANNPRCLEKGSKILKLPKFAIVLY